MVPKLCQKIIFHPYTFRSLFFVPKLCKTFYFRSFRLSPLVYILRGLTECCLGPNQFILKLWTYGTCGLKILARQNYPTPKPSHAALTQNAQKLKPNTERRHNPTLNLRLWNKQFIPWHHYFITNTTNSNKH